VNVAERANASPDPERVAHRADAALDMQLSDGLATAHQHIAKLIK